MYSKNDYRYYLERRCAESSDFLMHYGVKGMKWKHHKSPFKIYNDTGESSYGDVDPGKKTKYSTYRYHEVGIESRKNPNKYISVSTRTSKNTGRRQLNVYTGKTSKKYSEKKIGPVTRIRGEEGTRYKMDITSRKTKKKLKSKRMANRLSYGIHSAKKTAQYTVEDAVASRRRR